MRQSGTEQTIERIAAALQAAGAGAGAGADSGAGAASETAGTGANATPILAMVSGGSDSVGLACALAELAGAGRIGPWAVAHVNHHLRGEASDGDAAFVRALCEALGVPCTVHDADVARLAAEEGGNVEAIARRERYRAAAHALCALGHGASGCIVTAHTQNDRVENFYMRSIVGTGPGGLAGMARVTQAPEAPGVRVVHAALDVSREQLRELITATADANPAFAALANRFGGLWREDATNADQTLFRNYVRHTVVPAARERNPRLLDTLCRTMDLVADEDRFMDGLAREALSRHAAWLGREHDCATCPKAGACSKRFRLIDGRDPAWGVLLAPAFGCEPPVVARRAVKAALDAILHAAVGPDARTEAASVAAVLAAWGEDGRPRGGWVTNIQGNFAVSANKRGVRIEPMAEYRARTKRW